MSCLQMEDELVQVHGQSADVVAVLRLRACSMTTQVGNDEVVLRDKGSSVSLPNRG